MKHTWRNLEWLTRWLRRLLYLGVVIELFSLDSAIHQRKVFRHLLAQGVAVAESAKAADHSGAWASGFVSYPVMIVALATLILAAVWIYRAAANMHAIHATGMTTSPGWAVGWYFIPIANFWKPYQAMREIHRASAGAQQQQTQATPVLLRLWWLLWLLGFLIPWFIGTYAGMTARHGNVAEGWLLTNAEQLVSSLIDMPLNLAFALLIARIWQMQSMHAAPPSAPTLTTEVAG